jgi:N-methylhydantoinase B/oxoprolinase/acetone carboxylase alpha subunit
MKPGDAYLTNDPWMGTGHLNDFVITTPAFNSKGELVALFSCTSHLMDIGGIGFGVRTEAETRMRTECRESGTTGSDVIIEERERRPAR